MTEVVIIADDLTGALDCSVVFAGNGRRVDVVTAPRHAARVLDNPADVVAVNTGSREIGADEAGERVRAVVETLAPLAPRFWIKKIDSRLKGHLVAETAPMLALGFDRVVAVPAIPELGRRTEGGFLSGAGVARPIAVAGRFAGLPVPVEVPDTVGDGDLDRVFSALGSGRPLFAGARGLTGALARHLAGGVPQAVPVPRLAAPLTMAIGSRDEITLRQIARLAEGPEPVAIVGLPNGSWSAAGVADAATGTRLFQVTPGAGAEDGAVVGERFAAGLAARLRADPPGSLLACGGETARALIDALGIGLVEVHGEIFPGVPVCRMAIAGRTLDLVTKSGGFGGPDLLVDLVRHAGSRRTAA